MRLFSGDGAPEGSTPGLHSNQRFGWMLSMVFAGLGILGLLTSWPPLLAASFALASMLAGLISLARPSALLPLNRLWFRLGHWISLIISPLVLSVIFFGMITPLSILSRLRGRDELLLKRRPGKSYWLQRPRSSLQPESFRNQY